MRPQLPIYAGRLERLLAYLIDAIILLIPTLILTKLMGTGGLTLMATFIVNLAYYVHFNASNWQATPGKRLMGIYIIRTDYLALNQRDALERFLALIMPSLPLHMSFLPEAAAAALVFWLSLVWYAPILFTNERMGYHDRLCKTRVVVGKVGT